MNVTIFPRCAFVMARFEFNIAILVILCATAVQSAKLNVPRVLIPLFSSVQVNFTLEVSDGGCYKWSSSRDDVASVRATPGAGECSHSARVFSSTSMRHRNTAIILAEDVRTKQVLRCDVIVDNIVSLDVVTTTRELYVEEAPEAFEIRAYDDQGNEFTTLEGVDFQWTLVSPLKDNDVIRIMSFSESSYDATEALQSLEARGLRGHTALIEGVKTGSAKVIMRLPQHEYENVKPVEVTLRVVANLLLVPSEAVILAGDSVQFKIVQVREGRLLEVPQPSPQYSLQNEDKTIATLHPKTGLATGSAIGTTRILLRDAGEDHSTDGEGWRPPEALLRVTEALRLQLDPRPWSLQEGHECSIHVRMLDSEDRTMVIGPQTRISVVLDEELFEVTWRSINGSVVQGRALRPGKLSVTATLVSVAGKGFYPKISTTGEINIYKKIDIIPPDVVLPWDSGSSVTAEYQLRATGGDGTYAWKSEGSAISVGRYGMLSALGLGNGTVTASVPANPHIFATASVRVVEPSRMEIVWNDGESPVGVGLALHVALYSARSHSTEPVVPYTNCDQVPFDVIPIEGVTFERMYPKTKFGDEKLVGDACTIIHVVCSECGLGRISVRHGKLHQDVKLACYAPLTRMYPPPQHSALLLTVGSTANVIFAGGPTTGASDSDPRHKPATLNPEVASVIPYTASPHTGQQLLVYTVACLKLGQTDMTLKVYRGSTRAVLTEARLAVHCNSPHSLKISVKQPSDSLCPISPSSQVPILNGGGQHVLEVAVADMRGNVFHNATSLRVKWVSRPTVMLSDVPSETLQSQLDDEFSPVPVVFYHYQTLSISSVELPDSGVWEIVAEVTGYRNSILKAVGVSHTPPLSESPRAVLSMKIVKPVHATGEKLVVYNLPGVEARGPLFHGSGHLRLVATPADLARVSLDGVLVRSVKVQTLQEGRLTIAAHDLCVETPIVTVEVLIVSAHGITSDLPPLIEKGQAVEVWVCLLDRSGVCLSQETIGAPDISVLAGPGLKVTVGHTQGAYHKSEIHGGSLKCTVVGLEEGEARLDFSSGAVRGSSHTRVYLPLRVAPRTTVLLPGGGVKLSVVGGPPHPATVKFALAENSQEGIIKIQSSGVVEGLSVGTSIVEARAEVGSTQYGRAAASVRVRMLDGVAIHAPTATLLAGNTMPVWATGMPEGIGPIELGSLRPALQFSWSISGDGSASISDVLGSTNVELDNTDRVSVRLTAVRAGRVTIHLNVSSDRGTLVGRVHTWSANLELVVAEPLRLMAPVASGGPLLLAPHSSAALETNYDADRVTYRILEDDGVTRGALVEVSPEGRVTSLGRLGRAVITISGSDANLGSQQHVTLSVEVCPIHYMMIQLPAGLGLNSLSALPQGLDMRITASHHDVLGRQLAGQATRLRYYSTRSDITHVKYNQNTSVEVLLGEPGKSMFRLTDVSSDKQFSDYVSFKVQPAIYPQTVLATVGDVWCARSGVSGAVWGSSDASALRVSPSGLVQARAQRPAPTLLQLAAGGISLQATAPVVTRHADKIYFLDPDTEHVFTDEKPYIIPLVLANHEEHDKITNVISRNLECMTDDIDFFPFTCQIKHLSDAPPHFRVTVDPVLDTAQGSYGCRVTWLPDSEGSNSSSANRLSLVAHSGAASSTPVSLRAVRAARTLTTVLHLSPAPALAAELDVSAPPEVLEQLKVIPGNDALSVLGPDRMSDTISRYIIKGSGQPGWGVPRAHVRVISELTHQDIEVAVNFGAAGGVMGGVCPNGGGSPLYDFLQSIWPLIWSVAVAICVIAAVASVRWGYSLISRKQPTPIQVKLPNQLDNSQIRSVPYASRSPLASPSPLAPHTPPSPQNPQAGSTVYGDPSFLASPERRWNRRFL